MTDVAEAVTTLRLPRSADLVSKGTRVSSRAEHDAALDRVEAELARLTRQVKFCPYCAGAFVPEAEGYEGSCAGCERAEAAERALAGIEKLARQAIRDGFLHQHEWVKVLNLAAGLSASPEGEPAPQEQS